MSEATFCPDSHIKNDEQDCFGQENKKAGAIGHEYLENQKNYHGRT